MPPRDEEKIRGLASLYSKKEIKDFVSAYLICLLVAEGLIFFFCWISFLTGEVEAFPWKAYLLAAFLTPVAVTFLLGVVMYGFNRYLFERPPTPVADDSSVGSGRLDLFLNSMQRVPFLLALLLLVAAGGVAYKLDAISAFLLSAGEQAARSMMIALAVLLGTVTLVGLVWMVLSYRLRRQRLELLHDYRKEVVQRTGMILLEDETLIDRDGNVVSEPNVHHGSLKAASGSDLLLLPQMLRKKSGRGEKNPDNE